MEATLFDFFNSTGPAQLLIASIWQGLLLTACVWAGLKLAAAFGLSLRASTRFYLWLIVFLLVALLPALSLLRSVMTTDALAVPTVPVSAYSLHLNPTWAFVLQGLWLVSALYSLVRLVAGGKQMRVLFLNSTPVPFNNLDEELQSAVTRPGARPVQIRLSDAIDAPSVIGFFRPAVVVPHSLWKELDAAELRQIVLHELAHLNRGDDWTNLLQKLLRALCPLNPALVWAERHLCQERERACDDAVLDVDGNARAYARCLTKLAESRLVRRAASLAPGLWKRPSELASRVDNILHRRRTLSPWFSRGVLAASFLASVSGALLLQRCPGLIAFTSSHPVAAREAAMVVPAEYHRQEGLPIPQGVYHDAVFHLESNPAVTPVQHARTTLRLPARKAQRFYASSLRWVEIGAPQDEGEVFTLIMFTVEVPQATRLSHGTLPLADLPDLSLSDNWFAFQI